MPKTLICSKKEDCESQAAGVIVDSINALLEKQDKVILAVPGGRSVAGIFDLLKIDDEIDWNKIHIFMVDERLVPIDHDDSNFKLVKEHLIEYLVKSKKLPRSNIHPFIFDQHAQDKGISAYEKEIKKFDGKYDIVLLSSGEDGHVGALYPNHHAFEDGSEYYIKMDDSPKPPPKRMSISRKMLLRSKVAIVLFFGEAKMVAFSMFNAENVRAKKCPAKLVFDIPESYAFTDIKE